MLDLRCQGWRFFLWQLSIVLGALSRHMGCVHLWHFLRKCGLLSGDRLDAFVALSWRNLPEDTSCVLSYSVGRLPGSFVSGLVLMKGGCRPWSSDSGTLGVGPLMHGTASLLGEGGRRVSRGGFRCDSSVCADSLSQQGPIAVRLFGGLRGLTPGTTGTGLRHGCPAGLIFHFALWLHQPRPCQRLLTVLAISAGRGLWHWRRCLRPSLSCHDRRLFLWCTHDTGPDLQVSVC